MKIKNISIGMVAMLGLVMAPFLTFSQAGVHEVIIISTNDVHGHITNYGKMAAYVKELKKTNPDVFVFNAGDLINGNPVVDEAKDKGYPMIDLMNTIPYTLSCFGNHEFENGEAVLQRRVEQSTSLFIDANVSANSTSPLKPLKPYHILHTSDGTAIAVLGLTTVPSNPCMVPNVTIANPIKTAMEYKRLRDSCQIFMALTHIGYKQDSVMATQIKEFDVIVGGHSHTELPHGLMVNGVLITQTGAMFKNIGKTVLKIKDHKLIGKSFELINCNDLTATDKVVQAKIDAYNKNSFGDVVGVTPTGFKTREQLGSVKADAIAQTLHLDIAFDHTRNVTHTPFPKGNITLGDVYEIDSFDYHVIQYSLTAADIKTLILNSVAKKSEPVLFVSGITYTLKKNAAGENVDVVLKDKNGLLDEHKHYSVGMNSYIACHFMRGNANGTTLSATPEECLLQYLKLHPSVDNSNTRRVFTESL